MNTSVSSPTTFIKEATAVADKVNQSFSHLSPVQLNWKPNTEQWSVGQCLDHLITTNTSYFPAFGKIIAGEHKATAWERVPLLPSLFGKVLIRSLEPTSTRKLKAPEIFRPASSKLSATIVENFLTQQARLIEFIKASEGLNIERIIMTSPASSFVTYSLADAYRIILVHERRHVLQAQRVIKSDGFPR
jgi:DinB superfamily